MCVVVLPCLLWRAKVLILEENLKINTCVLVNFTKFSGSRKCIVHVVAWYFTRFLFSCVVSSPNPETYQQTYPQAGQTLPFQYPGMPAYSPEQLLWMQQMYAQQMAQYMQL